MADAPIIWNPTNFSTHTGIPKAGPTSYSSPPLMSEVNNGSDTNQIIALTNRRISQFGVGTIVPYVSSGNIITKSWIDNLKTQINLLRNANGLPSFSFTNVVSGVTKETAAIFTELRTAIAALVGLITFGDLATSRYQWRRDDNPYGVIVAGFPTLISISGFGAFNCGKGPTNSPFINNRTVRQRILKNFSISGLVGTLIGCTVKLNDRFVSWNNTLETFAGIDVYCSNTDDHTGSSPSIGDNLNRFLGEFAYGNTVQQSIVIPLSLINSRLSTIISLIYGQQNELTGGGVGVTNSPTKSSSAAQILSNASITLDWGF